ncbi:MAG: hypothetical protein RLY97_143 [Pseudomonadota bacterium]
MPIPHIPPSWQTALTPALNAATTQHLTAFLESEHAAGKTIYPPQSLWFNALTLTPLPTVKVVILGQDPYHGKAQAHGLAFSVPPGIPIPPSLRNIYKELESDLQIPRSAPPCNQGNLESWARQGVLLLNTVLTVEDARPASHQNRGWEAITDAIITAVAAKTDPCVFLLWGSHAQKKSALITGQNNPNPHKILTAPHPSPLSAHRGFLGCRHFSQTNAFLTANGRGAIDWHP